MRFEFERRGVGFLGATRRGLDETIQLTWRGSASHQSAPPQLWQFRLQAGFDSCLTILWNRSSSQR